MGRVEERRDRHVGIHRVPRLSHLERRAALVVEIVPSCTSAASSLAAASLALVAGGTSAAAHHVPKTPPIDPHHSVDHAPVR
jgi:hypothetical protein